MKKGQNRKPEPKTNSGPTKNLKKGAEEKVSEDKISAAPRKSIDSNDSKKTLIEPTESKAVRKDSVSSKSSESEGSESEDTVMTFHNFSSEIATENLEIHFNSLGYKTKAKAERSEDGKLICCVNFFSKESKAKATHDLEGKEWDDFKFVKSGDQLELVKEIKEEEKKASGHVLANELEEEKKHENKPEHHKDEKHELKHEDTHGHKEEKPEHGKEDKKDADHEDKHAKHEDHKEVKHVQHEEIKHEVHEKHHGHHEEVKHEEKHEETKHEEKREVIKHEEKHEEIKHEVHSQEKETVPKDSDIQHVESPDSEHKDSQIKHEESSKEFQKEPEIKIEVSHHIEPKPHDTNEEENKERFHDVYEHNPHKDILTEPSNEKEHVIHHEIKHPEPPHHLVHEEQVIHHEVPHPEPPHDIEHEVPVIHHEDKHPEPVHQIENINPVIHDEHKHPEPPRGIEHKDPVILDEHKQSEPPHQIEYKEYPHQEAPIEKARDHEEPPKEESSSALREVLEKPEGGRSEERVIIEDKHKFIVEEEKIPIIEESEVNLEKSHEPSKILRPCSFEMEGLTMKRTLSYPPKEVRFNIEEEKPSEVKEKAKKNDGGYKLGLGIGAALIVGLGIYLKLKK